MCICVQVFVVFGVSGDKDTVTVQRDRDAEAHKEPAVKNANPGVFPLKHINTLMAVIILQLIK